MLEKTTHDPAQVRKTELLYIPNVLKIEQEKFTPMYPKSSRLYEQEVGRRTLLLNEEPVRKVREAIMQHRNLKRSSGSIDEKVLVPPLLKSRMTSENKPFAGFTRDRNGSWNFTSLHKMIEKESKDWNEDQLAWFMIFKPYGLGKVRFKLG